MYRDERSFNMIRNYTRYR